MSPAASSVETPQTAAAQPLRDAFDRIAPGYDNEFTDSLIGCLQREAVWRQLDGLFPPASRILDLGCGTGADAIHFARAGMRVEAIDVSAQMIAEARRKIAAEGLTAQITTHLLALEDLGTWDRQSCLSTQTSAPASDGYQGTADRQDCLSHLEPFDAAISNFGAINCVPHLRPLALALSRLIRPGGHLALNLISRFCLWEALFYSLQGRFAKASRRWSDGGRAAASLGGSTGFSVSYRSVREITKALQPEFRLQRRSGIGILVPPTYVEAQARRVPKLIQLAARVDRAISSWPACRATADHTLLVFRRER